MRSWLGPHAIQTTEPLMQCSLRKDKVFYCSLNKICGGLINCSLNVFFKMNKGITGAE